MYGKPFSSIRHTGQSPVPSVSLDAGSGLPRT
jgi:hypothetical protein